MTLADTNRDLLARARKLAARAGFEEADVRPLDRGLSSDIFTIERLSDDEPAAVAKLQRGHRGKVYAESAALAFLDDSDVGGVPRVLLAAPTHQPPALVLSWLPGANSTLEETRHTSNPAVARQLGAWLARLHETRVTGDQVKMSTDPLSLTERVRTQARNAVERAGPEHTDAPLLTDSLAWLERELDTRPSLGQPRRLIHRDLRPHNIVLDAEGALAGVVDFEHAAAADPAWDFAKLQWWCFDRIPWLLAPFTEGYTRVRPLPAYSKRRVFRVFEATTLLAYFAGKQDTYEHEARHQLEAELSGAQRPKWSGNW
ncbi:MAG: aminoglycoside phosphotransferase family protein [Myxococcota bacterium]